MNLFSFKRKSRASCRSQSRETLSLKFLGTISPRITVEGSTWRCSQMLIDVWFVEVAVNPRIVRTFSFSLKIWNNISKVVPCKINDTVERKNFFYKVKVLKILTLQSLRYDGRKLCDHSETQCTSSMQAKAMGGNSSVFRKSPNSPPQTASGETSKMLHFLFRTWSRTTSLCFSVIFVWRQAPRRNPGILCT